MKELTYEDWLKNPTARLMWVWGSDESNKKQRKVIYFFKPEISYPIIALSDNEEYLENFKHCAEIEEVKTRRMTHKELSRWLREKPTREWRYKGDYQINITYAYSMYNKEEEVAESIVIRENDGEWKEPLVEID